jgi:error-prone DNA polymerase
MITPYVETKLGFTTTATLHPRFRGFLADGRGVVIYHEHVLRILADCMGITLAEADALRRTMGKDPTIEQRFRDATARRRDERGRAVFTPRHIDKIWAALESFGSFGFCKAHACAFAVTTYESAWLKTHYPTQFMAGLLEHDPGMYPKRLLATEARRLGIPLLGVDVNHSSSHYHVEEVRDKNTSVPILSRTPSTCGIHPSPSFCGALRVALARSAAQAPRLAESRPHSPTSAVPGPCDFAQGDGLPDKEGTGRLTHGLRFPFTEIAGISDAQVNRLIANQPYCSIVDVIERARPSRPILIKLATIGAFDSLCPERTRGDIIAHTRHLAATTKHHEPAPGQDPLWDSGTVVPVPGVTYEGRKNWDKTVPSPTVPPTTGHSAERSDSQNPDSTVGQMGSLGRSHCHTVNDIVGAELEILGVDVSAHLLDPWREYLGELGVTPAGELIHQRGNASVLVAGVRVASGTPPTKTGQRVAFVSLDDGTGVADVAFFHDAQMETGPQLFRAQLMLVEGVTRRTGELGVSVTATRAWDLTTLTQTHTPLAINTGPSD